MKLSIVDLEVAIRTKVVSLNLETPFTFDADLKHNFSPLDIQGNLLRQESPFFEFTNDIVNSYRVGPSAVSPTRYLGDLYITYYTKDPSTIKDVKLLESTANEFSEKTIDGIRFRTFTPFQKGMKDGFTAYSGVINFDFELYRGS